MESHTALHMEQQDTLCRPSSHENAVTTVECEFQRESIETTAKKKVATETISRVPSKYQDCLLAPVTNCPSPLPLCPYYDPSLLLPRRNICKMWVLFHAVSH